jgi:predicted transcriptional regulator
MKGAYNLGQSKMEMYLAVIKVLDHGDSMTQQQIMHKAGINLPLSTDFFNFLVGLEVICEKTISPKVEYFITKKGHRLCDYFGLNDDNSIFTRTKVFRSG